MKKYRYIIEFEAEDIEHATDLIVDAMVRELPHIEEVKDELGVFGGKWGPEDIARLREDEELPPWCEEDAVAFIEDHYRKLERIVDNIHKGTFNELEKYGIY